MIIKKYSTFVSDRNEMTNEGLKDWLVAFLMLANVGAVPLSVKASNDKVKKEFVDTQPQSKIDAAKFVDYITKNGSTGDLSTMWYDFISKNVDIKSDFKDVEQYLNKDGRTYHFNKAYKAQNFKDIDINKFIPVNYLTDMGDFIEDPQEPNINNFISNYEKKTSVEICIITVPSLGDMDEFTYAQEQFQRIGIGKKGSDNGILMVFSKEDRKWRIHTGYGVEGLLTDVITSRIGRNIIVPNFKNGDYYGGIMEALQEISVIIDKSPEDIIKYKEEQSAKDAKYAKEVAMNVLEGVLYLSILFVLSLLIYKRRKKRKDMEMNIDKIYKDIEYLIDMSKSYSVSESEEVDNLFNIFKNISSGINVGNIGYKKESLERIKSIYSDVSASYEKWTDARKRIDIIKSDLYMYNLSDIVSKIDSGVDNCNKLMDEYGVDIKYDPSDYKSELSNLDDLISKIKSTYKSSISEAENIFGEFRYNRDMILRKSDYVKSTLASHQDAERNVSNWRSRLDNDIDRVNRYSKWGRSSEKIEIDEIVKSIENTFKSYDKKNILKLSKFLEDSLSKIFNMERTWKNRKDDEEEEEEYRVRSSSYSSSSYSSSSSSYDSSSSSSSFGGFGGGSSGGGGSGGSW